MKALHLAAAAAVLLTAACSFGTEAPAPPGFGSAAMGSNFENATVQVENTGFSSFAIYSSQLSTRLGTVDPGQTRCLELKLIGEDQRLIARPVGGGDRTVSPPFTPHHDEGWSWKLGTNPVTDRISLERSDTCS